MSPFRDIYRFLEIFTPLAIIALVAVSVVVEFIRWIARATSQ
jgi:hypothetical protein